MIDYSPQALTFFSQFLQENTRAHPSVDGWSDPLNSKYYIVIVQYTARLHTEKMKSFVHKLSEGRVSPQTKAVLHPSYLI